MGLLKKIFLKDNKKNRKNQLKEEITSDLSSEAKEELQKESDLSKGKPDSAAAYCEQIIEASKQLEELKVEYQAVTSYLTDMQKIERMPSEEKDVLNETAGKIITLSKERAKYQNNNRKITDVQFKNIAKFEDIMPAELSRMMKNEAYHSTVKNDMRYLEGEKGALKYQKEETIQNQNYLRKLAVITFIMVGVLFSIFIIINHVYNANTQISFFLTIIMAMGSVFYIFVNARKNRRDLTVIERKLNKAINLLNKVKIKYINNTNELDYSYQKYIVNSYAELNYLWEQYLKAKEEEKHYQKNSDELEFYNKELIKILRVNSISDPDIWIYQAAAIVDSKEMVEVRHRLNVRRQKLRERIDYNNSLRQNCIDAMNNYINKSAENKKEVSDLIRKFGIDLE